MRDSVGYRIKYFRSKLNMTQAELSKGIISVSYLSKIENGNADPPEEILELLKNRLDITQILMILVK
ncbi:helix-turn-helix domain-containing protein [Oceanobacillus sp. 143]|nr:helix-turn-helix domain-containing protein [Oceanobacillus sp. 143]